jgi:hypothetical protein
MMKKIIAFIAALCCAAVVFAEDPREEMPRFEIPTARSSGFGGPHIAYTDNVFALLVNPAAIMRVRQRSFFAPSFTLLSPEKTLKLAGDISGDDFGAALKDLNNPNNPGKIPLGAGINEFPLSIAWVADGFGFGIWDRVFVNANVNDITAEATVLADLVIPVGFAFKILDTDAHDVDAGVALKFFTRGYGHKMVNIVEVIDGVDDLLSDLGAPVVMGAGFDLGFIYRWNIGFSAGITFDDIVTHGGEIARIGGGQKATDGYYVPFSLNLGVAYDLNFGTVWKTAPRFIARSGVTVAFDWHNFDLVFGGENPYLRRNPVLGIGLGLQFNVVDTFKLRLGMNEMLPAFGFGFDLGSFEIDIAYYGKELGLEPGQMSTAALDLTFAFRPGAKERHWPWTKTSLVEVIKSRAKQSSEQPVASSEQTPVAEPESNETSESDEGASDDFEFIYEEEADAGEVVPVDAGEAVPVDAGETIPPENVDVE